MAGIIFRQHRITSRVPRVPEASKTHDAHLDIRLDPLTGDSARIVDGIRIMPASRPDLSHFEEKRAFCPFCGDVIERATGTFDPAITAEPRIRRGTAAVVPNVFACGEYSAVGVYDTDRHFIDIDEMTPQVVADLLRGLVAYTQGVHSIRPLWHSINAGYLPPSGASMVHPHAQTAHDEVGTSMQRRLVAASTAWPGGSYWRELIEVEAGGPRWLGQRGRVSVLTPWAPTGMAEVWALLPDVPDLVQLSEDDCRDLGAVVSAVLAGYREMHLAAFNWVLFGGGPSPDGKYGVVLKVVSRAGPEPMYRSDVTYFERLHGDVMLDMTPEETAARLTPALASVFA